MVDWLNQRWSMLWDNEAGPGWDWMVVTGDVEHITGLSEALARRIIADALEKK